MTRHRTFKDPAQQRIYDLRRSDPPTTRFGGGLVVSYWFGFENPTRPAKHLRNSAAYAAWAAGVDAAKAKA